MHIEIKCVSKLKNNPHFIGFLIFCGLFDEIRNRNKKKRKEERKRVSFLEYKSFDLSFFYEIPKLKKNIPENFVRLFARIFPFDERGGWERGRRKKEGKNEKGWQTESFFAGVLSFNQTNVRLPVVVVVVAIPFFVQKFRIHPWRKSRGSFQT